MTPEAQQRAIAIACGKTPSCAPDPYVDTPEHHEWQEWRTQEKPFPLRYRSCNNCQALHIEGERFVSIPDDHAVPDYRHDLNAMNQAEKTLERQDRDEEQVELNLYAETLRRISLANRNHYTFQATAAQRARAFLEVRGLWVEETESQPV